MKLFFALIFSAAIQFPASKPMQFNQPPSCPLAPVCQPGGVLSCDRLCNCTCQYPTE